MLSIIICTYNRDKYLYNVLKSLAENDFPRTRYEIVLVNNNCTDNTDAECQRFQRDFPDIIFRSCNESRQGLSYARNRGIQEAKGDVLIYVDDDALVNQEYLKTYADFFANHPDVDAAGGPIIPQYETQEPPWMSHYIKILLTAYKYHGTEVKEFASNDFPGGGNAAYRASVFRKVGLFNVDLGRKGQKLLGSEEKDIFDKMRTLGMKIYYLPNAVLYHLIPEKKLEEDYFERLTFSMGQSERVRTLGVSKKHYYKRLFSELIKWGGTIVLWLGFALKGQVSKGNKLIQFRKNVTKGLLGHEKTGNAG